MKYVLTADQKAFFERNQCIEFEGFLTDLECATLKTHAKKGRDNFRQDSKVNKIVTRASFADIAKELLLCRHLRLGFDELIEFPYTLEHNHSLAEMYTVSPLLAGLMIALDDHEEVQPSESLKEQTAVALSAASFQPFPKKRGNAIFFSASLAWQKEAIEQFVKEATNQRQRYLLIGYAGQRLLYVYQPKDPQTHTLKTLGYVFGDRLKETTHPCVGTR